MAEEKGALPSVGIDPKVSLYGITEGQLQEIRDAQQAAIRAAEQQYEQPNWFKVAAGFAKPQLGGFLASLGSASEAMGENVEKQRAMQLPIAQMRSQLAQTNVLLGQNKSIADEIAAWRKAHPGQMPPADLVMEWRAKAPSSPTVSSIAEQQKLGLEQQQQAIQVAGRLYDAKAINNEQYAAMLKRLGVATQLPGQVQPSAKTAPSAPSTAAPAQVGPQPYTTETGTKVTPVPDAEAPTRIETTPLKADGTPASTGVKFNLQGMSVPDKIKTMTAIMNETPDPTERQLISQEIDRLRNAPKEEPIQKPLTAEELGASGPGSTKMSDAQIEASNKRYEPQAERITYFNPDITGDSNARLIRLAELMATPGVQKGAGLLYQDQGILSSVKAILAQGINASAGAGGTGVNFSVAFPVETALTKSKLNPKEQEQLREFQQLLSVEGRNDLTAAVRATGGGHLNQAEFTSAMSSILSGSDPFNVLKKHIAVRLLENERNAKLYEAWGAWQTNPETSIKPYAWFFHNKNSPYVSINSEYAKRIKEARRME
jgi:hypothetical protein